ncbi:ABC transporter substrate-binding protein [Georgenia yuyongxinii]
MQHLPRRARVTAAAVSAALLLAACSPGANDGDADSAGGQTVTFRLWDDVAAPAYEESFAAFTAANPDITVEVEVVPWADYWERLPLDISSGDMADIFWTNTSNFGRYADNGNLIDIDEAVGDHDAWQQSVADLYLRDGTQWGVPQLWDSIALFYNRDLVEAAGVDPADLTWAPGAGEGDTLLAAARALTTDAAGTAAGEPGFDPASVQTYGFNAQLDLQAIYVNFLAENGAAFQEGDRFAFASPEGEEAFQYLVDLVNTYRVAPSAADTNTNGDVTRDLFLQGKLGLFQSGPYNLKTIAENADFAWGLAPMVAGPEGRIGVVHGVAAAGNAQTENLEATTEVLRWLGSAAGQAPLARQGVAFPGAVDAQQDFVDYWAERDVDLQPFLDSAQEPTAPSPLGPNVSAGSGALTPILQEMFLGTIPVPEALRTAQDAANAAIAE